MPTTTAADGVRDSHSTISAVIIMIIGIVILARLVKTLQHSRRLILCNMDEQELSDANALNQCGSQQAVRLLRLATSCTFIQELEATYCASSFDLGSPNHIEAYSGWSIIFFLCV